MRQTLRRNPIREIRTLGQSIWLDFIRRGILTSGEFKRLMEEDGISGITSNPTIFEKVITGSHDYDEALQGQAFECKDAGEIYERLEVEDVQRAADLLRPVYEQSDGLDGFASLEVSPHIAYDTQRTIDEAGRLWAALNRPNVMIKVPATKEGVAAIEGLTATGINVNVTLLFGLGRYVEVAEAYISGLENRAAQDKPLGGVASVASFFLSRIDVLVDQKLEQVIRAGGEKAERAADLRGMTAIASAKVAYEMYNKLFTSDRFDRLISKRARMQRLLWASTSTKNPAYSDVKYVEALIGQETVNSLPLETIHAYRDHGDPAPRLAENVEEAHDVLKELARIGIDMGAVTRQLEQEGVRKFSVDYDKLLEGLEKRCATKEPLDKQKLELAGQEPQVEEQLDNLQRSGFNRRMWRKDATLWKVDAAGQRVIRGSLGWLDLPQKMEEQVDSLSSFADEVRQAGFRRAVLLGMGGSSLAPLVFERTFGAGKDALALNVLDTTDPATILDVERRAPLEQTLFILSSKSGTTAEPLALKDYFYSKVKQLKGDRAGDSFVAITDPGSPLVKLARDLGFRNTFTDFPDVVGRYSALSYFGLAPAALLGLDVSQLLWKAGSMAQACAESVPVRANPAAVLGTVIGVLAREGMDKLTLVLPDKVMWLAAWMEQLIAESTGKSGVGVLPVAGEPVGDPSVYGKDRVFVSLRLEGNSDDAFERRLTAMKESGRPVVTIQMDDLLDVGQEFFRWELATAAAGWVLGVNAFDQPDVEESKAETRHLLAGLGRGGGLPQETATLTHGPLSFFGTENLRTSEDILKHFFYLAKAEDYFAIQAYLPETFDTTRPLQDMRTVVRDKLHIATTLGYGPRYLHSTGQFHKGGPNTGLFLQITADNAEDVPIPGRPYSFGIMQKAQALGDFEALRKRGRRIIRVHLGGNVKDGLEALAVALARALG